MGYEVWEHWGEVLYHAESIYNVNGVRMTLGEYQMSQNVSLKKMDIQLGSFNNMILVDDWMAIKYDIITTNPATGETKKGTTMELPVLATMVSLVQRFTRAGAVHTTTAIPVCSAF